MGPGTHLSKPNEARLVDKGILLLEYGMQFLLF